jgi:glycosyltransferase involved in cell wall biosynthesis
VKKARIGIDCLFAIPGKTSGTWAFAKSLLEELLAVDSENEYFVFLNRQAADDFPVRKPNLHLIESRLVGSSVARRLVYQNSILMFLLKLHSLDLLHCLGNYGPIFPLLPLVVTVHDVTWFFDRECDPGRVSSGRTTAVDFLLRRSLRRANRIIVDSEYTRRQLVARYNHTSSKTTVVYLGLPGREKVSAQEVEERLRGYGIRRPFLLAVGLYLPHKNIGRLIEAFARIKRPIFLCGR